MFIWIIGFVFIVSVFLLILPYMPESAATKAKRAKGEADAYEAHIKACAAAKEAYAAECAAFGADTEKLAGKIDEVIQEHIKTLARNGLSPVRWTPS